MADSAIDRSAARISNCRIEEDVSSFRSVSSRHAARSSDQWARVCDDATIGTSTTDSPGGYAPGAGEPPGGGAGNRAVRRICRAFACSAARGRWCVVSAGWTRAAVRWRDTGWLTRSSSSTGSSSASRSSCCLTGWAVVRIDSRNIVTASDRERSERSRGHPALRILKDELS